MKQLPDKWSLYEKMQYLFFQFASHVLGVFPLNISARLGRLVGRMLWPLATKRKKIIFSNLNSVYGESISQRSKKTIAFKSFVRLFEDIVVLNKCSQLPCSEVLKLNKRIDEHFLSDELRRNKGAIILSGHISNFSVGVGTLGFLGYKIGVAVRSLKSRPAEKTLDDWRLRSNIEAFDQGSNVLSLTRHLAKGGIVWFALDQNARTDLVVEFLGRPATTFMGPVKLARKFGVPIVPVFTHRTGPTQYELQFKPPIKLEKKRKTTDEELMKDLRCVMEAIEKQILTYPEEWFWFHRRWRTADKLSLVRGNT